MTRVPTGHGEVLTEPRLEEWPGLLAANGARLAGADVDIDGTSFRELRTLARSEARSLAASFSERLGVECDPVSALEDDPIVMTGHQPDLFHPGIWVKDFLLQRIADTAGCDAIDLVVDSDGFEAVTADTPCMTPRVGRCRQYLAIGSKDSCYARAPVPSAEHVDAFCLGAATALNTLSAPAVARHMAEFCGHLRSAVEDAENLAEVVTFARRRFEAQADTTYLELPVTTLARSEAFRRFVVHLARNAEEFATVYNEQLAEFRVATGTRSSAQPFPDLGVVDGQVELPLWVLGDTGRRPVWARRDGQEVTLVSDGSALLTLDVDTSDAVERLGSRVELVPKALTLTLFSRLFIADLFIHGVGGGRYDRVTDGVIRRFFSVEPPAYVVASMTMYLPLGASMVTAEDVSEAESLVNRFEHNPDQMLESAEFESAEQRLAAEALVEKKAALVEAIAAPGADKKALGARIREVNDEISQALAGAYRELVDRRDRLRAQHEAARVLFDRTYPFCLWSPLEVADKVR